MITLTDEEEKLILDRRRNIAERKKIMDKQAKCSHTNKKDQGRWGHNGDQWWRCDECGKEWYD